MTGYGNQPISQQAAKELLALPLEDKVVLSREKIEQWYDAWGGKCYVSFSGGKDSTVLAYLAAKELSRYRTPIYPLTLVFVNTGLEYPEIQHFANDYVAWLQRQFTRIDVQLVRLRPKMNIRQVLTGINAGEIGKTVFLTREEAEKALEAMK
jgi:3'-phosphoadenosine 5'-phosphosulfate sulfotransferase (PAPS reductase)/FAD synthetase|nr:MAG TPA: phosphoadenosine-phosphosulfate reductase [Caudoviricetes sp.]